MSLYINNSENNLEKEELCFYGTISYLISGIIYFYYLNSIKDCDCVNNDYVNNIKKYFIIGIIVYVINCVKCNSKMVSNILSIIGIICGFNFVYNVRMLLNDIYKKNCECANTRVSNVINVLNYISIFIYIHFTVMMFLLLLLMIKLPNNENNNINDEIMMDIEKDDVNEENKEIFKKIIINLREKKMNGGNVENLARNFLKNNMNDGLKKILKKLK